MPSVTSAGKSPHSSGGKSPHSGGKSPHSGGTRTTGSIPVSERQQMALVLQMTSDGSSGETSEKSVY